MWGKKKTPAAPDSAELASLRKKQIETLRSFNADVKEIQKDNIFEIPVSTSPSINLSVVLNSDFPNKPPTIYVAPPLAHPWVDPNMTVTGHPKLSDWGSHSALGKIIKEIGKEFKSNPPRILSGVHQPTSVSSVSAPSSPASPSSAPSITSSSSSPSVNMAAASSPAPPAPAGFPHSQSFPGFFPLPGTSLPPPSATAASSPASSAAPPSSSSSSPFSHATAMPPGAAFKKVPIPRGNTDPSLATRAVEPVPELLRLSTQELEGLLSNDQEFEKFLKGLDKYKNSETIMGDLREQNERLAEETLAREQVLKELQEALLSEQEVLRVRQNELDESTKKLSQAMKKYSPPVILGKLRAEVRKADEQADEVSRSFINGDIEVNEFLKSFIELKKVHHRRAAKLEMVVADPSILSK